MTVRSILGRGAPTARGDHRPPPAMMVSPKGGKGSATVSWVTKPDLLRARSVRRGAFSRRQIVLERYRATGNTGAIPFDRCRSADPRFHGADRNLARGAVRPDRAHVPAPDVPSFKGDQPFQGTQGCRDRQTHGHHHQCGDNATLRRSSAPHGRARGEAFELRSDRQGIVRRWETGFLSLRRVGEGQSVGRAEQPLLREDLDRKKFPLPKRAVAKAGRRS